METAVAICFAIIFFALVFDFINGFHDTANAIATVVSTRVLPPRTAIAMAACLDLIGALIGTSVAKTISDGILNMNLLDNAQIIILSAVIGAVIWNLVTWRLGLPSSSSHALIGGLIGAGLVYGHHHGADWHQFVLVKSITDKVIIPLFASPLAGFTAGFIMMTALCWLVYKMHPVKIKKIFGRLQILSSALMALSHGMNDAQKSMGIITMSICMAGFIPAGSDIPLWVKIACAVAMASGTATGGWKIIKTMGHKIFKLETIHGFAAETASAGVIFTASLMGAPISTTHVISSGILGVGSTKRLSAVKWGIAGNIVAAWVMTIPAAAIISSIVLWTLHLFKIA